MATDTSTAPTPNPSESATAGAEASTASTTETLLTAETPKPGESATPKTETAVTETPVIPDAYDLKIGEAALDATTLEVMTPVFKELGLTQEAAQKLASTFGEHATQAAAEMETQRETQFNTWLKGEVTKNETAIRKEWGANFDTNMQLAKSVYVEADKQIGGGIGKELKQLFESTGFGSHPAVLKLFAWFGPKFQEDAPLANGANANRESLAQILYGNRH